MTDSMPLADDRFATIQAAMYAEPCLDAGPIDVEGGWTVLGGDPFSHATAKNPAIDRGNGAGCATPPPEARFRTEVRRRRTSNVVTVRPQGASFDRAMERSPAVPGIDPFGDRLGPPLHPKCTGRIHLESFRAWKHFVHDHFPWLELRNRSGDSFEASVTLYRVGSTLFSTVYADACEAIRSRHLAETSRDGHIKLVWQLSGRTEFEQDGRTCVLEAGQVGVCDTSRPYRMRWNEPGRIAVLMLPCSAMPGWNELGPEVCGRSIEQGIATRAALAALMSLNSLPAERVAGEGAPVIAAVMWMMGKPLRGELSTAEGEPERPRNALIAKARRHIAEHVADPTLGPDHVASALCMSRRSLYLLFKSCRMTPSKMIHDIRLNQAKRSLEDPNHAHQKMSHIALDSGFADYATFSRMFKASFGITPTAFRSQNRVALCA